jgi:hypothetical protein
LSTHLCLGLPDGLFPSGFPTNILHTFLWAYSCYMPSPFILIDLIIRIIFGEEYTSCNSSLCSFLQSPVTYLSSFQIFSSHPALKRSLSMSQTKFHTRTEPPAKL